MGLQTQQETMKFSNVFLHLIIAGCGEHMLVSSKMNKKTYLRSVHAHEKKSAGGVSIEHVTDRVTQEADDVDDYSADDNMVKAEGAPSIDDGDDADDADDVEDADDADDVDDADDADDVDDADDAMIWTTQMMPMIWTTQMMPMMLTTQMMPMIWTTQMMPMMLTTQMMPMMLTTQMMVFQML